jgi:predicted amidohydrolase YtcJ
MKTQILTNCKIYTFNHAQPIGQAALIQDGKILMVGALQEVSSQAPSGTEKRDLGGRTVLPAFTDAHIHLLEYGFSLQRVDCETKTRAECLERVAQRAGQTAAGEWILGHGWNHNIWEEGMGNKGMLDPISLGHPVYLTHKSLHCGWANSTALERAGIREDSPDPQGGKFQRDEEGNLTGILLEGAMRVLENAIPKPDQIKRTKALQVAQKSLLGFGITCVHDFDPWECYTTLQSMQANQELTLRVVKGIPLPNLDESIGIGLKSGDNDGLLTIGWLKLFADGALGPQTAAMLSPYEGSTSTGMLLLESEEMISTAEKALRSGISLAVHAIGDRANHEVLNAYAQINREGWMKQSRLPCRIEHVQLLDQQDINRLAANGIVASMQPIHATSDREMADRHWGERCRLAYAWNSVQQSGADLVFGSDAPVESPNPFWGTYSALTRKSHTQKAASISWNPQECLDLADILKAYISQPQAVLGKSSRTGQLKPDADADLMVLPDDPFGMNADAIADLHPSATMLAGVWVWNTDLA